MSEIKSFESLSGFISSESSLFGKLSCLGGLVGKLSVAKEYDVYSGEYKVVPKAFDEQTLRTANKLLGEDIVVSEVPYFEVGNNSNGVTAYIAKEA
jgi:hypothetical protein